MFLNPTTLSITTLSIATSSITVKKHDTQHIRNSASTVVMLNEEFYIVLLMAVVLNVVMLRAVMLSVMAP